MCDLNGPFKLCTCEVEVDRSKPHWILHQFLENKVECFLVGEFSNPNLYDQFVGKKIIQRLHSQQLFDFDYHPQEGDFLELFSKIKPTDQDVNEPDYRIEFRDGKWTIIEPFEIPTFNHQVSIEGEIQGPLTPLTKAYQEFLTLAREETLEEFDQHFSYVIKPHQRNLLYFFNQEKYHMFKCYKGEKNNPFDHASQNTQHMFWFYESIFEKDFLINTTSEWFDFFSIYGLDNDFSYILSKEDKERPSLKKKKLVFDLWLTYLFTQKLYAEYGGENTFEKLYQALRYSQ